MKSKKILIALVIAAILGYLYLNMNVRREGMKGMPSGPSQPMAPSPSTADVAKARMKKN